jgi:hypothetical protein
MVWPRNRTDVSKLILRFIYSKEASILFSKRKHVYEYAMSFDETLDY